MLLVGGVVSVCAAANRASAAEPGGSAPARKALVLPSVVKGAAAGKAAEWDERVKRWLGDRCLEPLAGVKPRKDELSCERAECLGAAALRRDVDLVVRVEASADAGGIAVRVRLGRRGPRPSEPPVERCEACGTEAAMAMMEGQLGRALAGADELGGAAAETTPCKAGAAEAAVVTPPAGGAPVEGSDKGSKAGGLKGFELPPPELPRWVRPVEGVLGAGIGVGVLTAGLGGRFVYIDGRPACAVAPPAERCQLKEDSKATGIGLLVAGGLVAAGSAAALAFIELRIVRRPADSVTEPAMRSLSLSPVLMPGYAGLSLGGDL